MDCNQKGNVAMLKVAITALEKGAILHRPLIDSCRYDYVIDWKGKLYKAQVKYAGRESENAEGSIALCLTKKIKGKYIPYSESEVDVLLMYCPCSDKVYWIDSKNFHNKTSITLRFKPCKNNMQNHIHFAKDFEW